MTRLLASFRLAAVAFVLFTMSGQGDYVRAAEGEQLVLLANGNVLRGVAIPQGELLILERDDGSHMRLHRDQVLHIDESMEALYEYRSKFRTFRNSASHIEDAKWCLRHGLMEKAKTELEGLIQLDPSHPERIRLERQIAAMNAPRTKAEVRELSRPQPQEPPSEPAIVLPDGISSAAIAAFATRVQPMLINRCGNAGCHRTGSDSPWQLSHLGVNVRVSATMTQKNIHATLPHINLDDPLSSSLLRFATTPHGHQRTSASGARNGYDPSGHIARSAELTLRQWLSQLGRYPQPLVGGPGMAPHTMGVSAFPSPIPTVQQASNVGNRWPVVQAMNADGEQPSDAPPTGFSVDTDGEWIYDPDGEFAAPIKEADANENATLNPEGWPAPILGPTAMTPPSNASYKSPIASESPETRQAPAPGAPQSRPKRLPTLNNPFSAELFNRQYQRPAPELIPAANVEPDPTAN